MDIAHILAPGAHARLPIIDRIHKVKVPVTFMCKSPSQLTCGIHEWLTLQTVITTGWMLKAEKHRPKLRKRPETTRQKSM